MKAVQKAGLWGDKLADSMVAVKAGLTAELRVWQMAAWLDELMADN